MKLAIMQPYFFPYIGYFQLIGCVDKFVIYDDVNFINRGWINRNRILINKGPALFTVPLSKASQNKRIKDIELAGEPKWGLAFLKKLKFAYQKAPYFSDVFPKIEALVQNDYPSIAALNLASIQMLCDYLGLSTELIDSSAVYQNGDLKSQERILNICQKESASIYINPIGGKDIYDPALFAKNNIRLLFLRSTASPYPQYGPDFIPNLSILDGLMFLNKTALKQKLTEYELE